MAVAVVASAAVATADAAPVNAAPGHHLPGTKDQIKCAGQAAPDFLYSPPDSNDATKTDATDSELSDLDEEPILDGPPLAFAPIEPTTAKHADSDGASEEIEDIGEVLPDHWSGNVPVFRPTMHQFSDFQRFMKKVDGYGMKSGIIKIIPPPEWKDAQPPLDDLVKYVKVREPIRQDIMGSNGTYRQVNILHGRSYNVPQWRQLCEQSEHQPPARRGERRANADRPKPTRSRAAAASQCAKPSTPKKRVKGRSAKNRNKPSQGDHEERPMTPVSPKEDSRDVVDDPVDSIERDAVHEADEDDCKTSVKRMGGARQSKPKTQSVSARRKFSRREGTAMIDEAAFRDFDYRMDISDYTPERCEELERAYWKTLTYASPLYGADLMGTLFDDRTERWNLNKLPNLLDVLGTKVPGVNTAYLYLGMWKATFAWHLEDVDLYSINYLHFGAPKQWYSISQADARRFEAAMKSIWPADAKACDQFLRHKGFLISPHHLLQHYGIKVNKVVSYPGEFVVTYPYGYHSGYNLGYNCAEAVNFALDSWLPMGKIAKRCECAQAQDSVWINVYEVERKLRGEETEYETEDEDDEDADGDGDMSGLPTPPASHGVRLKDLGRKRKRGGLPALRDKVKVRKIKLRLKTKVEPPCCLCPNDVSGFDLLPTEDGRKAHRMCAMYVPETYIDTVHDKETVFNVGGVSKERLNLKCLFCRSRRGACFQCSKKKCARAYHGTCAAAAGVFVEEQDVPVFVDDGTEFKERAYEFSCRFHRVRRDKKTDGDALEADAGIRAAAQAMQKGEIRQFQHQKGDIFAGIVLENRADEEMVLISVLPNGDRVEVEWKWLVLPDPADFHLPKASDKAVPMPASRKAQDKVNARRLHDDKPKKDDAFVDGYVWAEFQLSPVFNKDQVGVDFSKPDQTWHYLGKTSTDARAQYTEDPTKPRHNPRGNFLDTLPKPPKPVPAPKPAARARPAKITPVAGYAGPFSHQPQSTASAAAARPDKPYAYKPKTPIGTHSVPWSCAPPKLAPAQPSPPPPGAPYQHSNPGPRYSTSCYPPTNSGLSPAAGPQAGTTTPLQQPTHSGAPILHKPPPPPPQQKPAPVHHSRPTWQVHSSVYYRYPFFQVNHNRDSSKYRTPYAPWGGFTNGYQGDLRAHLMTRQSELLRRPGLNQVSLPVSLTSSHAAPSSHRVPPPGGPGDPSLSATTHRPMSAAPMQQQNTAVLPRILPGVSKHAPHNGARPPAAAAWQHSPPGQQATARTSSPMAARGPKTSQVGMPAAVHLALKSTRPAMQSQPKQSPVPLPANFLAAMASAPNNGQTQSGIAPAAAADPPKASAASEPARARTQIWQPVDTHASESSPRAGVLPVPALAASEVPAPRLPRTSLVSVTTTWQPNQGPPGEGPTRSSGGSEGRDGATALPESQGNGTGTGARPKQEFTDAPGCESMKFVERMMENLKRASQRGGGPGGA